MITKYYTDEHKVFRQMVRKFVDEEVKPYCKEWDEAGIFPREIFKKCGDLGLFGLHFSKESGGAELDYYYTVILQEELARCLNAGFILSVAVQTDMATPIIDKIGTPWQKETYLVPAIAGEKIGAICVTEPGCGSDVAAVKTTAKKEGDYYIINGTKTFITNGTRADFLTMVVRTGGPGYQGISSIIFPTDTPGFEISNKLKKMGHLSSDTAELSFDNCKVHKDNLLGNENQGFMHIMMNFQSERLVGALMCVFSMENILKITIEYTKQRELFGKKLSQMQVTRHKLADLLARVEAVKQLCYYCAERYNNKKDATKEISMAKLLAGDLSQRVAYECVQLHGGYGYCREYEVENYYRDTRLASIGGGASEVMKDIISKMSGL